LARQIATIDGNEAAAYVAHKTNEVIAIYPITPSSPMGEWADQWSAVGETNIWGTVPLVVEMQAEGGAAGAVHGALQTGALTTTFTASQGLLLMIPNMYKIAGELTSAVFHIAARSVAAQALSIFGDHSDMMAARSTGWGMLFSNSIQEIMDFALIAQASTLAARVPFLHAFDGFRSSHEINKIEKLSMEDMRAMIDDELVRAHRERGLSPDHPVMRGTAQNPDVFFQARETVNPYYLAAPQIVQDAMDKFASIVGRSYHLFDYVGAPDAERVIVLMGSGAEAAHETVEYLAGQGEKVGVIKVRLYRPFSVEHFLAALPPTVKVIATLDRTKEPGGIGEPLYQDALTALNEGLANGSAQFETVPVVVGGRYGLSSKEFNPAMIKGVFDMLASEAPKNHFTVGIEDDVTHTSIDYDPDFSIEPNDVVRAMFWGLGADGTVGANKNSIKIIGEETDNFAQGYFVYDSKKSGARTISHLRFGPRPIKSTYLINKANFVAVHQFGFLERYKVLDAAADGAVFLLNSPYSPDEVWDQLPRVVQEKIIAKHLQFYVIDGYEVAKQTGMGVRINTIMQTCFFAISGVLPREEAITQIKKAIKKTYGKRGEAVVKKNYAAVDAALDHLHQIEVPAQASSEIAMPPVVPVEAPEFVQEVTAVMIAGDGDALPVSKLPIDGTYPTATTQWEKRNVTLEVPVWEPDLCIQCGKCVFVCPHSVIRAKIADKADLAGAPAAFKVSEPRFKDGVMLEHHTQPANLDEQVYTIQVAVEDCTGCKLCVEVCPAKDKSNPSRKALNMAPQLPIREEGRENWDFFLGLPEVARTDGMEFTNVKNVQFLRPLFEFSGACAGCGETPYVKLLSQLYGDRAVIANATGCSSIYGGNLPTTPYAKNDAGRGPAWSNSLFEDNAEFGMGMRLTLDKQTEYARELVDRLRGAIGSELAEAILSADQSSEAGIAAQRERVAELKALLPDIDDIDAANLLSVADKLVKKNVWIVGGDGWAYDIGYGGLDHVLASGRDVNVLVLDTEVYSNTGGQSSKATPLAAVAKFAAAGKPLPKKDLGLMAISYGNVYVAQVAMGASDRQTLRAFLEAESYAGPSLIIAYTPCINHGIDMSKGLNQQALAVEAAAWPLYRFDPRLKAEGKNPFQLDSKGPRIPLSDYAYNETRYKMLTQSMPERAEELMDLAQQAVYDRWAKYEKMAAE
jgi:pyruvate-ferredoxin/flavodoxin oxidoreductase